MKRAWMIALVAMLVSVSSSFAEMKPTKPAAGQMAGDDEDHGSRGVDRRMEAMTTELKLSKAQQADLRKILEESRDKQKELRKEMNEKRKAMREETDTKISALLKADQKKKFDAMKMERGGRMKDAQPK